MERVRGITAIGAAVGTAMDGAMKVGTMPTPGADGDTATKVMLAATLTMGARTQETGTLAATTVAVSAAEMPITGEIASIAAATPVLDRIREAASMVEVGVGNPEP